MQRNKINEIAHELVTSNDANSLQIVNRVRISLLVFFIGLKNICQRKYFCKDFMIFYAFLLLI